MAPDKPVIVSNPTLHLPRILCLHGGGTNARIFRAQCRALVNHLRTEYRFVFAQAPFASNCGSDVLAVYSQWGPFRRWLRWRREHPEIAPQDAVAAIDESLSTAIHDDDRAGYTGEWIAILGFSQGAKVAASLLYRQQMRGFENDPLPRFRFGVLLAGQAPLVLLDVDSGVTGYCGLPDAAQITDMTFANGAIWRGAGKGDILCTPTLHVHGLRDPGLERHRVLFEDFCARETARVVQWDGDHRVPLKLKDVALVAEKIRELARET
ncbi:ovarian cancer-associated gene 2 protein homolog [Aspergillus udagawae]|uniref:Ovarian cancer-associated gene 2 protein homolog n=1 Tax=Aspergillus udagawae TaxID=91492 RepID=A0ABQ1AWJ8_9EURO|nr:ovarian cancer-associated gene 2 protein homolog [Aspergillus udagawae]GFF89377.1 ovarian cancer-associated gene 2 protein homolog [Aspergillus udagawae]GFG27159.1 ovarian cancer-associated gene 2 protein homolog [Aspergillus udagawae]